MVVVVRIPFHLKWLVVSLCARGSAAWWGPPSAWILARWTTSRSLRSLLQNTKKKNNNNYPAVFLRIWSWFNKDDFQFSTLYCEKFKFFVVIRYNALFILSTTSQDLNLLKKKKLTCEKWYEFFFLESLKKKINWQVVLILSE